VTKKYTSAKLLVVKTFLVFSGFLRSFFSFSPFACDMFCPRATPSLLCASRSASERQCISRRIHNSSSPANPSPSRRSYAIASLVAALAGLAAYGYSFLEPSRSSRRLSDDRFTPLKVCGVKRITPDTTIFQLALPSDLLPPSSASSIGAISSLALVQPDLQIQRPYTPLDLSPFFNDDRGKGGGVIELLVKKYEDGEVSKWLHRSVREGDELSVRGPLPTWKYEPGKFDELVFVNDLYPYLAGTWD
jgi:hypothetical protein